jgi:hypothetical protein
VFKEITTIEATARFNYDGLPTGSNRSFHMPEVAIKVFFLDFQAESEVSGAHLIAG